MKCENCGKNEVSFVYRSNINGRVTEKHLCSECADKLGYTQKLAAHSRRMMEGMRNTFDGFLGSGGLFGPGLLDGFFTPERSLPDFGGFFGWDLPDGFFQDMPAIEAAPSERPEEDRAETVSKEEQGRFARMRELNKLRMEMRKAVREENFERAAELRDQIHAMEQEGRESK